MLYEKRWEKGREKQEERTKVELRHSTGNLTGKENGVFNIICYKCLV